jgi:hypothetical protein
LPEYHSDDETEKTFNSNVAIGGGNLAPEVLKMLQQITPPTEVAKVEEEEPDEIKVIRITE